MQEEFLSLRFEQLLCEYRINPLGIDTSFPRFSWKVSTPKRGSYQKAYQILVATTLEALQSDVGDMWDSGKVESGESINVPYRGKPLQSRTRYYWKVRIWDEKGFVHPYSTPAWFETALLSQEEWKGSFGLLYPLS
ncbi:MAG: hypothetical protein QXP51_06135 [Candidatus Hadarchaeales archaeon]